MLKKSITSLIGIIILGSLVLMLGCSDDNSPTGLSTGTEQLAELISLVQSIAPPVYDGPSFSGSMQFSPLPADSFWLEGDTPWIGKAFGDEWPTALYTNVSIFDDQIKLLNFAVENGVGTHTRIAGSDTTSVVVEITDLSGATTIPTEFQTIYGGTSATFDKYYHVTEGDDVIDAGISATNEDASVLIYQNIPEDVSSNSSRNTILYYAYANLTTGTLVFSGAEHKVINGADYSLGFKLNSLDGELFDYNMSYYVNNPTYSYSMVECLTGGGDKDGDFVLRHAKYLPADGDLNADDEYVSIFNPPDYTYVNDTVSANLTQYITDSRLYDIDDLPSTWFSNPWD